MKASKKVKEFIEVATGKKHPPSHIYKAFAKMSQEDHTLFVKSFGFFTPEINKIGFEKFVKANGWTRKEHALRWKTDMLHNIICPACKDDFGILEDSAGLCENCKPHYWYELIPEADILLSAINTSDEIISSIAFFITEPTYRELFRKKVDISCDSADNEFLQLVLIAQLLNNMFARNEIAVDTKKEVDEDGEEYEVKHPVFINKELHERAVQYTFKKTRIIDLPWFTPLLNSLIEKSGATRLDGHIEAVPLMHYLEQLIAEKALENMERKELT